jgi:Na+/H+ antiporter NhaD/arsenite permease-like protein
MIQRIQSIFLLAAALVSGGLFFLPFSQVPDFDPVAGDVVLTLSVTGVQSSSGTNVPNWPLLALNILIGLMCLVTIFQYKNRPLQIKLTMFCFLLSCILLVAVFWYSDRISSIPSNSQYLAGVYLLFVQLFVLIRAIKSIRKDEDLVRSADRLR